MKNAKKLIPVVVLALIAAFFYAYITSGSTMPEFLNNICTMVASWATGGKVSSFAPFPT